jgi:predicted  nucleic acid-binding Zn-ribbon protein
LEKLLAVIKKKHQNLGIDGRQSLIKLKNNKFLQLRVNALALKSQIHKRLRDRKFELDRLERAYRQTTSNENKLNSHIQSQVKQHEPSIVQLVTKFNKLCGEMAKIKAAGNAPIKSLVPTMIEKEGLFNWM